MWRRVPYAITASTARRCGVHVRSTPLQVAGSRPVVCGPQRLYIAQLHAAAGRGARRGDGVSLRDRLKAAQSPQGVLAALEQSGLVAAGAGRPQAMKATDLVDVFQALLKAQQRQQRQGRRRGPQHSVLAEGRRLKPLLAALRGSVQGAAQHWPLHRLGWVLHAWGGLGLAAKRECAADTELLAAACRRHIDGVDPSHTVWADQQNVRACLQACHAPSCAGVDARCCVCVCVCACVG